MAGKCAFGGELTVACGTFMHVRYIFGSRTDTTNSVSTSTDQESDYIAGEHDC